jgi:hypothetical protein
MRPWVQSLAFGGVRRKVIQELRDEALLKFREQRDQNRRSVSDEFLTTELDCEGSRIYKSTDSKTRLTILAKEYKRPSTHSAQGPKSSFG